MRWYAMAVRLTVPGVLVLASLVLGGWKWDHLPGH
jgi:hypothetical protein